MNQMQLEFLNKQNKHKFLDLTQIESTAVNTGLDIYVVNHVVNPPMPPKLSLASWNSSVILLTSDSEHTMSHTHKSK